MMMPVLSDTTEPQYCKKDPDSSIDRDQKNGAQTGQERKMESKERDHADQKNVHNYKRNLCVVVLQANWAYA